MNETIIMTIFTISAWSFLGFLIYGFVAMNANADGLELVNPYWCYRYYKKVNWFGACLISLALTISFPTGALCYWFYKLCTVGRKN